MIVWRISLARHAPRAFSGEGAVEFSARWNHKGTRVVYASSTLALAALEMFVNLNGQEISTPLVAISAEIPEAVKIVPVQIPDLPENWRSHPGPPVLQDLGSGWVEQSESAILSIPSALIPAERNYLINPRHPDFPRIKIRRPEPFGFDPRMWKRTRH